MPGPGSGVSVARAATIIMAGNVLSRLLGFARDQAQAIIFGLSDTVSGYITALTVQTSIYDLLVSGVISAAFIPVFSRLRDDEDEFGVVAGTVLTITALAMGLAVLVTELFPAQVITLYMHDPATHPGGYHAALGALRLMAPAILFLGISGVLTALLYARERFVFPAFTPVVFNAAVVTAALLLHRWLGINSLAVGVLVGAAGQVALQWYGLRRIRLRPGLRLRHPEVRRIAHLYWPVALGLVITQGQVALDSNLQWITGDKSRAALALATRLFQLPLGIVGTAMSLGSLPTLSTQQGVAFRATLSRGLSFVTMLMVPAVVGLYFLGEPFIALAFQHGRFHAEDTLRTTLALHYYLPGLAAAALDQLLIFAFYARHDTRTPVVVGLVSIGAYLLVALVALGPLNLRGVPGMEGLALADSAKQITHMTLLLALVWITQGSLRGTGLGRTVSRVSLAGLAMAAAFVLGGWVARGWLHGQGLHLAAGVAGVAGVAGIVYVGALHLLGVSELTLLRDGVGQRLRRRARAGGAL